MNLLLLKPQELKQDTARLGNDDRRYQHLLKTLGVKAGDRINAGILNGQKGYADITVLNGDYLELQITPNAEPPPPNPITLILALPRPLMLKRILQTVTSMGVKTIYLINSKRVEKSYWNSSDLDSEIIAQQLLLGLEQACDTVLPNVHFEQRFKPFAEDKLPELCKNTTALLAHPGDYDPCPGGDTLPTDKRILLAVGPEGGFIDYEVELLTQSGLMPVQCGKRILRVEAAVSILLGRLTPMLPVNHI